MITPKPWSCQFHCAASPGVAIVGCGCPLNMDSQFHGRGIFELPLSASLVRETVVGLASSESSEANLSLHRIINHKFEGSTVTTPGTETERLCDGLAASHIGAVTGSGGIPPIQLASLSNGESSNQMFILGRPRDHPELSLQEQRNRASDERYEMQSLKKNFFLFPNENTTRRAAATHPPLQRLEHNPTNIPMQPPEIGADWSSLQPNRQQPPPAPRIMQLPDPDLDDVEEGDYFPSLDELDRQRQTRHVDENCNSGYSVSRSWGS